MERKSGRRVYADAATIPRLASTADQIETSLYKGSAIDGVYGGGRG
jgi:hypothetical protein